MSVVHERLQRNPRGPQGTWFLKLQDGSIYGPVNLATLCDWAAQSRIAAGNLLSQDQQQWMPASEVTELKMEWNAQLKDGTACGPFNMLAVPYLYQKGVLPIDAILTHKTSGKTMPVHNLIKSVPPGAPEAEALVTVKEQKWERLYQDEKKARLLLEAELQQTLDKLKDQSVESEQKLTATTRLLQEYEGVASRHKEIEQGIRGIEDELRSARATLKATEEVLAEQRSVNARLTKESTLREKTLLGRTEELERKLQSATQQLHERQETSRRVETLDSEATAARQREQELVRKLKEQEQQAAALEAERRDIEALRKQVKTLQSQAEQETRSFDEQVRSFETASRNDAENLARSRKQIEELEEKLRATASELKQEKTVAGRVGTLEPAFEDAKKREQELLRRLKEQEQQAAAVLEAERRDIEALRKQVKTLQSQAEQETRSFDEQVRSFETASRNDAENLARSRKQIEELEEKLRATASELKQEKTVAGRVGTLEPALEDAKTREQELAQKLKEQERQASEALESERRATADLRNRISAMETGHTEQVHAIEEKVQSLETRLLDSGDALTRSHQLVEETEAKLQAAHGANRELQAKMDAVTHDLERQKHETLRVTDHGATRESQLNTQVEQLKQQLVEAQAEVQRTQKSMTEDRAHAEKLWKEARATEERLTLEVQSANDDSTKRLAASAEAAEKLKTDLEQLNAAYADLQAVGNARTEQYARETQELRSVRKALEADLASTREAHSSARVDYGKKVVELSAQLQEARESLQEQAGTVASLARQNRELRDSGLSVDESLEKARRDAEALRNELTEVQRQADVTRAEKNELQAALGERSARLESEQRDRAKQAEEFEKEIGRLNGLLEHATANLQAAGATQSAAQKEMAQLRAANAETVRKGKDTEALLDGRLREAGARIAALENESASIARDRDAAGKQVQQLREEVKQLQHAGTRGRESEALLNNRLREAEARISGLEAENAAIAKARDDAGKQATQLRTEMEQLQKAGSMGKEAEALLNNRLHEAEARASALEAEKAAIAKDRDAAGRQVLHLRTEMEQLRKAGDREKETETRMTALLREAENKVVTLETEKDAIVQDRDVAGKQIQQLLLETERLRKAADAAAGELRKSGHDSDRRAEESKAAYDALEEQRQKTAAQLQAASHELAGQKAAHAATMEAAANREKAAREQIASLAASLEKAEKARRELEPRVPELEQALSALRKEHSDLAERMGSQTETITQLKSELTQFTVDASSLEKTINEERELEASIRKKAGASEHALRQEISRLEAEKASVAREAESRGREADRQRTAYEQMLQKRDEAVAAKKQSKRELEDLRDRYEPLLEKARYREACLSEEIASLQKQQHAAMPVSGISRRPLLYSPAKPAALPRVTVVLLLVAAACWLSYRAGHHRALPEEQAPAAPSEATSGADMAPAAADIEFDNGPQVSAPQPAQPAETPAGAAPGTQWPEIKTRNVVVRTGTDSFVMVFDFGLFTTTTTLAPTAPAVLQAVAEEIRPHIDRFQLIIEGHTDSLSTGSSTSVLDNHALAMARANTVLRLLVDKAGLPAEALYATSAGEMDPPFPNTDETSRMKNRTVVLKLVRR